MNEKPGASKSQEPLEAIVGRLLAANKLTLALAESCTGGLLGHRLTQVPGCSIYLLGGIIAYSYEAKERLLNVRHDSLYTHGAVSALVALEMARGARLAFMADIGVSVTGIAGPTGETPDKPVGLVYLALSTRSHEHWEQHLWDSDRSGNKARSAEAALEMLYHFVSGL